MQAGLCVQSISHASHCTLQKILSSLLRQVICSSERLSWKANSIFGHMVRVQQQLKHCEVEGQAHLLLHIDITEILQLDLDSRREDDKDWWDFEEHGSIEEAGGTYDIKIGQVRATGQLLEQDIVLIHSLETATYHGHYGKLETYIEEKQRWQVKLDKNDEVIVVKTATLSFIDSKSTLRMEFEVIMIWNSTLRHALYL
jgi:hypothetical protein